MDVTDCVAAPAEAGDEHLVVLIDEIQAAIPWYEGSDLLAVLDELHSAALPDGRVRLLRFDPHLLHDDALGVRSAAEGIALVPRAEIGLLVLLVGPALVAPPDRHLTSGADSARLPHGAWIGASREAFERAILSQ